MSEKLQIILNSEGIRELLKSLEIENVLEELADNIQRRAGEEFDTETTIGKNRVNVKIKPSSPRAYYSNLKHDTLIKALKEVRSND